MKITTYPESQQPRQPTMLFFAGDFPNILSLIGLLCAVLGIYYAILGYFYIAMIGVLWAVVFDWADGIVARRIKGRTDYHRAFGNQLDSLIDIVSFGVFPAIFLLSYGKFNPWFLPGAFLIVAAGVIRLSYFNIFGLINNKTYMGLALDNNIIILAFVFLFQGLFSHLVFSVIIYVLLMIFTVLNLSPIKTPKFSEKWFYILVLYSLVLTLAYSLMQYVGI